MIAPVAYRTQARAVTADDYAAMAERYPDPDNPEVAQAVAPSAGPAAGTRSS